MGYDSHTSDRRRPALPNSGHAVSVMMSVNPIIYTALSDHSVVEPRLTGGRGEQCESPMTTTTPASEALRFKRILLASTI